MAHLTDNETKTLKKAFKSTSQGTTNNQTFNDSSHGQNNLQQTGTSEIWVEDKKEEKEKEKNA